MIHLRLLAAALLLTALWLCAANANAYVVGIGAGTRALYLQVGVGLMSGGNGTFSGGATPGNNATVNLVSVAVPATAIGTGTQAMTSNSTQTASAFDNFGFCAIPNQVYVGGLYRAPGAAANATLSVTSPSTLTNGLGQSMSFNQISWVSGGNGDSGTGITVPSGTFAAGTTQTLVAIAVNTWFESCLAFNYANTLFPAAGAYNGRVTYTLSAP